MNYTIKDLVRITIETSVRVTYPVDPIDRARIIQLGDTPERNWLEEMDNAAMDVQEAAEDAAHGNDPA